MKAEAAPERPKMGGATLALLARKMFLSLNALGFLVDLPFSRRCGSLAWVHSHEEIARKAGNNFARTHLAVWIYDAHAVGDYLVCVLARNRKRIDGRGFWAGARQVRRDFRCMSRGRTCPGSIALGKLAPRSSCGGSRRSAHAFDCEAYSSAEQCGVTSLLRIGCYRWNL